MDLDPSAECEAKYCPECAQVIGLLFKSGRVDEYAHTRPCVRPPTTISVFVVEHVIDDYYGTSDYLPRAFVSRELAERAARDVRAQYDIERTIHIHEMLVDRGEGA